MKKIVLTAILVAAAFGGDFEEAAKAHIKAYDTQRSMDLFEKSCNSDKNGAGCYLAAFLGEQNGKFSDEDGGKKAFALYEKACKLGDMDGCAAVAGAYDGNSLWGVVESDYEKAAGLYEKACETKNADACLRIAKKYDDAAKFTDALKYYKLACEAGEGEGCYNAADIYESGDATPKNDAQAAKFYDLACQNGFNRGCVKFKKLSK